MPSEHQIQPNQNPHTPRKNSSTYASELSLKNKAVRTLWAMTYLFAFRPSPKLCFRWRVFLLRLFGAQIGEKTKIYSSVKFFVPSNAVIGDHCIIGPDVRFYNVAEIRIGNQTVISQHAHLCAATHDFRNPGFKLFPKPIEVGDSCWIAADAFVGPGVTIGASAVVGARAVVFKEVMPGMVVAGNPATVVGCRQPQENQCNE